MPRPKHIQPRFFLRGNTWWVAFRGIRESLETTDRTAAELRFKENERKRADPAYAAAHSVSLGAVAEEFLAALPSLGNRSKAPSPGTIEMKRFHLGHFLRIFGDGPIGVAVTAGSIDRYIATRRREVVTPASRTRPYSADELKRLRTTSASTVSKELGTLRQLLRFAARRGWFSASLESVLPVVSAPGYVPLERALTTEQIDLLLAQLPPHRRAIVCFVAGLGADACAIPRAVPADFQTDSVLIRGTKNSKRWGRVPILPEPLPMARWVAEAAEWVKENGGFTPWGKANSVRDLAAACRRAGIPRITLRDLRRSFGRILRAAGIEPQLIGPMLRHADGRMAERVYAGLSTESLGSLVASRLGTTQCVTVQNPLEEEQESR